MICMGSREVLAAIPKTAVRDPAVTPRHPGTLIIYRLGDINNAPSVSRAFDAALCNIFT